MTTSVSTQFFLPVDHGHKLHVTQRCGTKGVTLHLHGGPGSGANAPLLLDCAPAAQTSITYDQRGAGKSTYQDLLAANDLKHLVADIIQLRKHLGIQTWTIHAGSWGATLALAYACEEVNHIEQLVLRAPFLGRKIDWVNFCDAKSDHAKNLPIAYRALCRALQLTSPCAQLVAEHFYKQIHSQQPEPMARAWSHWERCIMTQSDDPIDTSMAVNIPREQIFAHYARQQFFLKQAGVLDFAAKITCPTHIVQSEQDPICPMPGAIELFRALPNATLNQLAGAGHLLETPSLLAAVKAHLAADS